MSKIHPTACIDPHAEIASDVEIGPYCIVEKGVRLDSGVKLNAHVVIKTGTTLMGDNQVDAFAALGGVPQDFSFKAGSPCELVIGKGTVIREGAVIHGATRADRPTRIGEHCYIMNQTHIGHDVQIGNRVVFAGGAMAAGFTEIGDYAVIGGLTGTHQWVKIGEGVMIGGLSRISADIPPFVMVAERNDVSGLNLVGLRRRAISREVIAELKACFHETLQKGGNQKAHAERLLSEQTFSSREAQTFLQFIINHKRPLAKFRARSAHD